MNTEELNNAIDTLKAIKRLQYNEERVLTNTITVTGEDLIISGSSTYVDSFLTNRIRQTIATYLSEQRLKLERQYAGL